MCSKIIFDLIREYSREMYKKYVDNVILILKFS